MKMTSVQIEPRNQLFHGIGLSFNQTLKAVYITLYTANFIPFDSVKQVSCVSYIEYCWRCHNFPFGRTPQKHVNGLLAILIILKNVQVKCS